MITARILVAALAASFLPQQPARAPRDSVSPLTSLSEPSVSPDGREIAFVSGGSVWTVGANGGDARILIADPATASRPLYSPDGSRIAFVSTRTGNGDVYVLTLASGELQRITFDDQPEQLDAWSRDGKWLYFSSSREDISGMSDEYRVHSDGGTPMPVAADRYAAEFWGAPSPDGSALAITARGVSRGQWWRKGHSHLDESEIDLVRDDAHGTPTYTPVVGMGSKSGWPMWSANGQTIFFVSDRTGFGNLWSQPVAGGEPRQLTHFTDGRVLWPAISTDGRTIVFERHFGVWKYDVASGAAAPVSINLRGAPPGTTTQHLTLTKGIRELTLSPDGRKIAFAVHGEIFAIPAKEGGQAIRVTDTPEEEAQPVWSPDSRRLLYTSDRDGRSHIYMYDFTRGAETALTSGNGDDISPHWSPDGSRVSYMRDGHQLHLIDVVSHTDRVLATGNFDRIPYAGLHTAAFSPDGEWLAFIDRTGSHDFANVYVVSTSGGAARPLSFLANSSANAIAWSPDGTYLLLESGQRTEPGELARIDLIPRTPHFREDQFRDLFREETPRLPTPRTPPAPDSTRTRADTTRMRGDTLMRRDSSRRAGPGRTRIVFDQIRERLSLLPIELSVSDISISPDGKSALLTATTAGQTNLYVYPLDPLASPSAVARQLTSTPGRKGDAFWSPDSKEVYYLDNGDIHTITVDSRIDHAVPFSAEMDVDFAREKMEVFEQGWRDLRVGFVDENMNGVNWDAVHAEYAPRIAGAPNIDAVRRLMSLMIGELNSSHSGIGGPAAQQPYTGRIGLRYDRATYERDGLLKVTEVTPLSPAAIADIKPGDYLISVNGTRIGPHTNLDELLAYTTGHRTVLGVAASATATPRDMPVRPVDAATDKALIYRAWVESRREYVSRISGGRLGYVHMFDMSEGALTQLYADLDAENMSREGVVIDVRNNNGGFVNVYAIDVLARQPYLTMQQRGTQTPVPARPALGQRALERPTVLVTNQHTLSDGEDFTQGYRALKLGKVVGEPTGGWIIFTGLSDADRRHDGAHAGKPHPHARRHQHGDAPAARRRRSRAADGRELHWARLAARRGGEDAARADRCDAPLSRSPARAIPSRVRSARLRPAWTHRAWSWLRTDSCAPSLPTGRGTRRSRRSSSPRRLSAAHAARDR